MQTPLTSDLHVLKNRLSLRALAEEAGARFHGASSRCPLHGGDNPTAFHLYDNDRRWHCFTRCPGGKNDGDLFSFYMCWKNVDFQTAAQDLQARLSSTLARHPERRSPVLISTNQRHAPPQTASAGSPTPPFPPDRGIRFAQIPENSVLVKSILNITN